MKIECQYRALELDASSSEAHSSMGVILEVFDWDWVGAEHEFKHAIALNPNHFAAPYEYGGLLMGLRKLDEAEAEPKKAVQIDPLTDRTYSFLRTTYWLKGETEKAGEHNRKSEELNPQTVEGENAIE